MAHHGGGQFHGPVEGRCGAHAHGGGVGGCVAIRHGVAIGGARATSVGEDSPNHEAEVGREGAEGAAPHTAVVVAGIVAAGGWIRG